MNTSPAQETVFLQGHIIDSLILPKVLDSVLMMGGTFDIEEIHIGATRDDPSHAKILVKAPSLDLLKEILEAIQSHGAVAEEVADCRLEPAPTDGVFPESFFATSHLPTQVRLQGQWTDVEGMEMDLGIRVNSSKTSASTVPMGEIKQGELVVTGHQGIRIIPISRPRERDVFGFMEAQVSSERPHSHIISDIAARMKNFRHDPNDGAATGKVLVSAGPAVVHSGGRDALAWLIDSGFVHVLFCGNALAAHDMEAHLFGTSLGYALTAGRTVPHGHDHHLRTINKIRAIGSIDKAVASGLITNGIMAACVKRDVTVVMAGTIRDDGPLPGVLTDSMDAQRAMRAALPGVALALLIASTLHSIATGNLLPATVPTVCVDVNPSVPTKLADRGSFQSVGLVMDAASFLRELAWELGWRP